MTTFAEGVPASAELGAEQDFAQQPETFTTEPSSVAALGEAAITSPWGHEANFLDQETVRRNLLELRAQLEYSPYGSTHHLSNLDDETLLRRSELPADDPDHVNVNYAQHRLELRRQVSWWHNFLSEPEDK